jgi:outer membrane protein assembly factor BamA
MTTKSYSLRFSFMRYLLTGLLVLRVLLSAGQTIQLRFSDEQMLKELDVKFRQKHASHAEAKKEGRKVWLQLMSKGYYSSSIDSIVQGEKEVLTYLFRGEKFRWAKLSQGNTEEDALIWAGYREKIFSNKTFSSQQLEQLMDRLLVYYENRGYPFASVRLDSVRINAETISGKLLLEKNKLYRIDSVLIKGDAKIDPIYLYHWIKIHPGDIYREDLLRKVDTRIREITFVDATQPADIVFTENQCLLIVYLKKKRASQFNGILGVLPDNRTGKITITGDARIKVKNGFGKGEQIDMNWRKLGAQVQDLRLFYDHPFLFKTSFGTDLLFKLYKQDSTFLELKQQAALQYRMRNGNHFRIYIGNHSTDLLSPKMFINAQTLPVFADVRTLHYGIGLRTEHLDYRFNPRKGYVLSMQAGAGKRSIRKNPVLPQDLYNDLELSSTILNGNLEAELFIPLKRRSTFRLASKNAFIQSEIFSLMS